MMMTGSRQPWDTIFAKTISVIFHPLLMPLYGLMIIVTAPTLFDFIPDEIKKVLLFVVLINNVILPLMMLAYLKYRKLISSTVIDNREERMLPLALTTFFYFITVYIFLKYRIPVFIKSFFLSAALISLLVMVINFWFMISIHGAGAGALLATVFVLSVRMHTPLSGLLISAILIAGTVLWSRLRLNSHTPAEAWTGLLLGSGVTALCLFIF
jgi:hypothetical protein